MNTSRSKTANTKPANTKTAKTQSAKTARAAFAPNTPFKSDQIRTGMVFRYNSSKKPYYATVETDEYGKQFARVYSIGTQSPVQTFDHRRAFDGYKTWVNLYDGSAHPENVNAYPAEYRELVKLALADIAKRRAELDAARARVASAKTVTAK